MWIITYPLYAVSLLAAKQRRITELEGAVRELTGQLALCRGKLYDRL
jgi:hypothetical protein